MEKFIHVTYSITKDQAVKINKLAIEKSRKTGDIISASSVLRKAIDKLPNPKKEMTFEYSIVVRYPSGKLFFETDRYSIRKANIIYKYLKGKLDASLVQKHEYIKTYY